MTEPMGAPPERWIVITGKIFKRSTNVKFPAADRLPVLHLIQCHRRDITPSRQEGMGCAAETRKGLKLSGRCFDDESHDKDCNRDGATEVSNVRVESFHAACAGSMSLLFFLWPMAKA